MAYTKTNWVNDESPDIDADNLNKMEQGIYDAQYPDGGLEGQLLARTATGKAWVDAPNSAVWGLIQGTLSDQTDLAMALENTGKVDTVNGIQPDILTKNVQVDIELTKVEYDALPISKESDDVNYYIKDGTNIPAASVISASGVTYSNTSSGLDATTVQGAIDENASDIADLKAGLTNLKIANDLGRMSSSANFETALKAFADSIDDFGVIPIYVVLTTASGVFLATNYIGHLYKLSNSRYRVILYAGAATDIVSGLYNSGTYYWKKIAFVS